MPQRSSPNKKGPKAAGGGATGTEKVVASSIAARRDKGKFNPPEDPYLRAVWKVRQAKDLSSTQQLALLALWRLLRRKPKKIGAGLLAQLIGLEKGTAKNIFSVLQQRGYIKSDGRYRSGRQERALRELTGKFAPQNDRSATKVRSSSSDQGRADFRSSSSDIDREVRHTRRWCGSDDPPAGESGRQDGHPHEEHEERTVRIADLVADDDPVKSGSAEGAT